MKPGWYWVLRSGADDLELAQLQAGGAWLFLETIEAVDPSRVTVHSGPIAHPYEGRWSGCPHAPEFRRGKRCVQCGTHEVR